MSAAQSDYDIVIAGGGMVGASLALMLSRQSRQQIRILVVESFPLPESASQPVYRPSFDARSSALSYGSRLILESLGLWPELSRHLAPIESIHVSERGRFASSTMSAETVAWPALGYVVENAWLGNSLLAALSSCSNVDFCCPASAAEIIPCPAGADVVIALKEGGADAAVDKKIHCQLVVVADGANSGLRSKLGIASESREYTQTALIGNVTFSKPHGGRAYERFTDQGPMALLPLMDDSSNESGENRAALVWTMPSEQAEYLCDCSGQEFLAQLQQRFGNRQGRFLRVGQRLCFPLQLVEACEQVRSSIVVMGNAAHSLHPVAGQGFNLALRDCLRLSTCLLEANARQQALGDLQVLEDYYRQQQFDQQKTVSFSDRVTDLFSNRQLLLSVMRGIGLVGIDILSPAKNTFIKHAAGMNDGAVIVQTEPHKQAVQESQQHDR